jgi:hypothetical protein
MAEATCGKKRKAGPMLQTRSIATRFLTAVPSVPKKQRTQRAIYLQKIVGEFRRQLCMIGSGAYIVREQTVEIHAAYFDRDVSVAEYKEALGITDDMPIELITSYHCEGGWIKLKRV